jgi:DNA-directed RNA polymerase specialized sigma24 family protein
MEGGIDEYSDEELIDGIYGKDDRVIKYIIRKMNPVVSRMVLLKGGKRDDVRYVMEETIVIIYSKAGQIKLTSSFRTYFFAIARNVWFGELRRRLGRPQFKAIEEYDAVEFMPDSEQADGRKNLVLRYYGMMPESSRELLRMMAFGYSNEEIMQAMNFSSIQYTKNRKSACLKSLIRLMEKDPLFTELQDID